MKMTVILPVHNGENFLEQSIRSVLKQDFDDFELLVLDDDSSDRSAEIAQSTGDKRLVYSRNSSRFGLFKTLNRGFSAAQSDLVRIWAHDDVMLEPCLREFYSSACEHSDAGLFYCDFHAIDGSGQRTGAEAVYQPQRLRTPKLCEPTLSMYLFFVYGCLPGNISTVMLRKETWSQVGGFVEGIQQAPDYDMWVRSSSVKNVVFLHNKLIELRDHPLQLAKLGQKQMTTIEEEYPIFCMLTEALSERIDTKDLVRFWRHNRGRQHMHWVARSIARGDYANALRGWERISMYGPPWRQFLQWLLSANGRFSSEAPSRFFDRMRTRFD